MMNRLIRTLIFIIAILFINTSFAIPKDTDNIRSTLIAQDIDYLINMLRKGYVGFHVNDNNMNARLERKLIRISKKPLTSYELCNSLQKAFSDYPDGHLSASIGFPGQQDCGTYRNKTFNSVGDNIAKDEPKIWLLRSIKVRDTDIPVIGIRAMNGPKNKLWDGFLQTAKTIKRSKMAIIDLRGNEGGWSDTVVKYLQLLRKDPLILPYKPISLRSAEADRIMFNKFPGARDLLESEPDHFRGKASKNYDGKLIILTDQHCASACEHALEWFRQMPNTEVYGQPTAGLINYGGVGGVLLPNSKVWVSLATQFYKYNDERNIELIGYRPDVTVPAGTDALEYVLNVISPTFN